MAVMAVLENYREPILNDIADKKRDLIQSGWSKDEFERLDEQEKAAAQLRSRLLSSAGGWKDLMPVPAAVGAVVSIANILKMWTAA